MAQETTFRGFKGAGMDTDSSPESVDPNDIISAINTRFTGTRGQEATNATSIESNSALSGSLLPGINLVRGGGKFDDTGQILGFRYNSAGNCQMILYTESTNTYQVIFTDVVDTGGETLLPLNPQNYVYAILINETYAIWWAKDLEVGYVNLPMLASGGYGTILWEDLSLLKPQCMPPPTGVYGSDAGQPANYLFGLLPQFSVQYINADFNKSAWSTYSKRIVPYQQNTPTLGSDVTQNNYIIVSVDAGSIRAAVINISARFGTLAFATIKSVDRSYVTGLPNVAIDISGGILEVYNPTTNIYSFVFYNNDISFAIPAQETDLFYDYIWPSNSGALVNGNIAAIADWKTLYARPNTDVTIGAAGYDPNIDIPAGTFPDSLRSNGFETIPDSNFSFNHKFKMTIVTSGIPHTGDVMTVRIVDSRNAQNTFSYSYTVPSGQDGDLVAATGSFSETIPGSNFYDNGDGTTSIRFLGPPYYVMQSYSIRLAYGGATVANSIAGVLDNTTYQYALSYRDYKARPFPLCTGNKYSISTPSYAQVNGDAIMTSWRINAAAAPTGAVDYQWLTTKPPVTTLLDVLGTPLNYISGWDAFTNDPELQVNEPDTPVGSTYQINAPSDPTQTGYVNLGTNASYNTGDYVVYNGQSWDILPKSFGDLTATGNILAISLNPLNLFNSQYAEKGVDTILGYDFAVGDRCTLHYYIDDSDNKVFINDPCVNLAVFGYDAGSYIVKVEKSATFDESELNQKNVFLRLYSPAKQEQAASLTQNSTVWYEIGERFTITNGVHDTLSGVITDGGVYFKTRQYYDAVDPYTQEPHQTLSTDFNYSDFYPSAYSSFGRVRTYYDVLEQTEQKASIITSQPYVLGSKNNGLTRFYPENIYGDSDGQISSSKGGIQVMWQRGQVLLGIQELGTFYIPVNEAYTVINDRLTGQSISSKLLNNGRYDPENVGLGLTKCFCTRYSVGYGIDPNKSLPFKWTLGGIEPISGKMSKYFKSVLQLAYSLGKQITIFYNDFYEEVVLTIQADGGRLYFFPFRDGVWNPLNSYSIAGTDVTATPNGAHCTAVYDDSTGLVTYTPTTDYVGGDVATFTFLVGGNPITVNNCLNWTEGSSTPFDFSFLAQFDVPTSTLIYSNTIGVGGIDVAVAISIVGGEYSINGGAFTSSAGTTINGDIIQVRQTSSGSDSTLTIATLTISTKSAPFDVTTASEAPPTTELAPIVTDIDYEAGLIHFEFDFTDFVSDLVNIEYVVQYYQDSVLYTVPVAFTFIPSGDTTTGDLTVGFSTGSGTVDGVIFTYTPTPNPAAGVYIVYTSPITL